MKIATSETRRTCDKRGAQCWIPCALAYFSCHLTVSRIKNYLQAPSYFVLGWREFFQQFLAINAVICGRDSMILGMRITYRLPYACQHRRLIKRYFHRGKSIFIWLSHLLWKFGLSTSLVVLPPWKLWRSGVSSVTSSSERISPFALTTLYCSKRQLSKSFTVTGNWTVSNWLDKIKFSFSTLPLTQYHSFLRIEQFFKLFTACQSGGERNWTLNSLTGMVSVSFCAKWNVAKLMKSSRFSWKAPSWDMIKHQTKLSV